MQFPRHTKYDLVTIVMGTNGFPSFQSVNNFMSQFNYSPFLLCNRELASVLLYCIHALSRLPSPSCNNAGHVIGQPEFKGKPIRVLGFKGVRWYTVLPHPLMESFSK